MTLNKFSRINSFVIILILSFSLLNTFWIIKDNFPPRGAGNQYINSALDLYNLIQDKEYKGVIHKTINEIPSLSTFPVLVYYFMFGKLTKNELTTNSIYLIILLFSTYKIAKKIYNIKVAVFSVIITNSLFIINTFSKTSYSEFHLLSFISLCFYLFLRTEYFTNRKYSFFLGIILGLTTLIKYSSFVYIGLIFILYTSLSPKKINKKSVNKIIRNISILLFFFLIFGGIFSLFSAIKMVTSMQNRFYFNTNEIDRPDIDLISKENFLIHTNFLFSNIGIIFAVMFLIFLVITIFKKIGPNEKLLYLLFPLTYLIFLFVPIKAISHLVPIYFVIPIILSKNIINKPKPIFYFLLIFCVLINVSYFSYSINLGNNSDLKRIPSKYLTITESVFENIMHDDNIKILIVGNGPFEYSDFIYFSKTMNKNFSVFFSFRDENGMQLNWVYNNDFNNLDYQDYSELIIDKNVNYIVIYYPKKMDSFKEKSYINSINSLRLLQENNNYELISQIKGSIEEEEGLIAHVYKLKI